jgi:hypothetical protein
MLTPILALFQAIPSITGGINNFVSKYYDAKVQITAARIGGDVDVAKALVSGVVAEGQTRVEFLKAVSQSKFLMFLVGGFALPWIIYEWKAVPFDNIFCPWWYGKACFTPTITGLVADWSGVILAGIFGTGSVMAVG